MEKYLNHPRRNLVCLLVFHTIKPNIEYNPCKYLQIIMTWNNSNPLANPLNQGQFNRPGAFIRNPNASVPPSKAFDFS